jgi:Fe-S cluster assembly protein SufD
MTLTEPQNTTLENLPEFLVRLRETSEKIFSSKGFPSNKSEEYKYLSLDAAALRLTVEGLPKFHPTPKNLFKSLVDFDAYIVIVVNGILDIENSKLPVSEVGVWVDSLKNTLQSKPEFAKEIGHLADISDGFVAKNTAEFTDGWALKIDKNVKVSKPIYLVNLFTGDASFFQNSRNLIHVGSNAEVDIYKHTLSLELNSEIFQNGVTELYVGENSTTTFSQIQEGGENLNSVNYFVANQTANSVFTHNIFTLSGKVVRNNTQLVLAGKGAEGNMNGVFIPSSGETFDNHTLADHRVAHCNSNELYKGVALGKGSGVFNGKIFVRKDAQKTNAYQSNKNILLSDDANIYTKPQLEIYADDVKCSHGSTTGQLDEKALFYMQARGIGQDAARKLLVKAFSGEAVNVVKNEAVREFLDEAIERKLNN